MKVTENIKTSFFTVLFIFLFLFIYTKLLGPIPFSVNSVTTTKSDLFTVSGEGEASGTPESASFSVGVTKSANTAEDAKNQINEITNKVVADLKSLGIPEKDIKTSNFSVNPDYAVDRPVTLVAPNGGTTDQKISSYTANQTIEVKTKTVDLANKAIDLATKDGANVTNNVQFVLSDDEQAKLETEARKEAIAKAKEKAKNLSDEAGIRLGRLINVQESNFAQPYFAAGAALDKSAEPSAPTQLSPGENTVHISVTLSYETL